MLAGGRQVLREMDGMQPKIYLGGGGGRCRNIGLENGGRGLERRSAEAPCARAVRRNVNKSQQSTEAALVSAASGITQPCYLAHVTLSARTASSLSIWFRYVV